MINQIDMLLYVLNAFVVGLIIVEVHLHYKKRAAMEDRDRQITELIERLDEQKRNFKVLTDALKSIEVDSKGSGGCDDKTEA